MIEKLKIENMTENIIRVVKEQKKITSKRCLNRIITQQSSCCGHISKENIESQGKFQYIECRFRLNLDLNASLNILNTVGHMEKAS